jgi:hypothetical protein
MQDKLITSSHLSTGLEDLVQKANDLIRIAAIYKTAAARAGMNPTNIAGHSVRAGMATQAALNLSTERAIARTTSSSFASCFATLHPAGRDVPRERVGEARPLSQISRDHLCSREITSYQIPGSS